MAAIVCKRRGDNYEMKDILDLNYFKVTNNPTSDREGKKVSGTEIQKKTLRQARCAYWILCFFICNYQTFSFISLHLDQSLEMSFSEMSASDFIAII